ncbi:MAG TPA: hypothetical protein VKB88_21875 [Bryobacteraceae bacterium]|nr:hypothetical protein [Bryobacteraceae bacterium]
MTSAVAEKLKLIGLGSPGNDCHSVGADTDRARTGALAPVPCTNVTHVAPQPIPVVPPPIASLDVLDRLRSVESGGGRDLSHFAQRAGGARRPTGEEHTFAKPDLVSVATAGANTIAGNPLVFYGYARRRGDPPLAFVLLDDEIHLVMEGAWIRGCYRLTGFRANALTVEDALTGRVVNLPLLDTL